ncbi:MAG: hypothetical protein ACLQU4_05115 [Limisphaerales bacterium]|jgi:hypothetical protein
MTLKSHDWPNKSPEPAAGILVLVWSFVAGWIGAATGFPTYVGTIELAFAKKIGYVSPDAEL